MDTENDPWIVPDVVNTVTRNRINSSLALQDFGFRMANVNEDFYFEFIDNSEPTNFIFSTKNLRFSYQDNFIHMKAMIKSRHLFGLG